MTEPTGLPSSVSPRRDRGALGSLDDVGATSLPEREPMPYRTQRSETDASSRVRALSTGLT